MNVKSTVIDKYAEVNNLANSSIINYNDYDLFTFYDFEDIPEGMSLADSICFDEDGKLKFGFMKGFQGEEMRLITGYTGSGKSMHYLLPQLLVALKRGHSAIVTDNSGQLLDMSYKYLKDNNINVRILNFGDTSRSDRYNPFYKDALRCKEEKKVTKEMEELIEKFGKLIVPTEHSRDINWHLGGRSIFKGLMYGMAEEVVEGTIEAEDFTIYNIVQQFYWLNNEIVKEENLLQLKRVDYYQNKSRYDKSLQYIAPYAENAKVTRAGYLGTLNDRIQQLNNSYIFDITSESTFDISELWEKQTVIFINTADKDCADVFTGLFVTQLYAAAFEESYKTVSKALPKTIQIFLDEFANIPLCDKEQFTKMLTTARKMRLFFNMFIQSYSQLSNKYDEHVANIIFANCTEVFIGTNDYQSRENFSVSCGKKLIETISSFCNKSLPELQNARVISPEVLGKMKKGEMYILRQGYDVINTFFEGAYNMELFNGKCKYETIFTEKNYDYEDRMVLQPAMVHTIPLEEWTTSLLSEKFTDDQLEEFLNIYKVKNSKDISLVQKACKYGILKKTKTKNYKPLIPKEMVSQAYKKCQRRFDFDF